MAGRNDLDEFIAKKQHEAEQIKRDLEEAKAREEENKNKPKLELDEVIRQMGTGIIRYEDGPIRFRAVSMFKNALTLPVPIDYLKINSQDEGVVSLLNDTLGISLTIQFTISERKKITFKEVVKGMEAQFKAAGIYAERIEEGTVEDEVTPLYFIAHRVPTAAGVMYQMTFYSINQKNGKMIIGSYNCFYKSLDVWENIIKATMTYLDFH